MSDTSVLVVGSGAIGGYFGALLARAGHTVTFLARGAHLEALRSRGVEIVGGPDEGVVSPVKVVADLAEADQPVLVLFAVKSYHTQTLGSALAPILGDDTVVLILQNGVDRAAELGRVIGPEKVLAGTVYMESCLEAPGVIRYLSGARRILFGEPEGPMTPRVTEVHRLLTEAGINAETPDDLQSALWGKFVLVCAANSLTALTRCPFGDIVGFPAGRRLVAEVIAEAVGVGARDGVDLGPEAVERSVALLESLGPALRSSMLRDIEAGRPTEVDALNGHVVRRAEELGVEVPLNRLIWTALTIHNRDVAKGA